MTERTLGARMPERVEPASAPVVLSMGGSVLVTGEGDERYLPELATLLRRLSPNFPLVVTAGVGGWLGTTSAWAGPWASRKPNSTSSGST